MKTKRSIWFGLPQKRRVLCCVGLTLALATPASAVEFNGVFAVPDYGKDDCVSFKRGNSIDPLDFTFGYSCVSQASCEVFSHGCMDELCSLPDYSKGTRTTLTAILMDTPINNINMASVGKHLQDNSRWCLVQDGAGNYWAMDKWRGTQEEFSTSNLSETVVPCLTTDYFSSHSGCQSLSIDVDD